MEKKILLAASALLACSFAFAQHTVLDTREAHPGKDLTMEEAIYQGVGYARAPYYQVDDAGKASLYKPVPPDERDPWDRGPAGYGVRLDGESLIGLKDGKVLTIGLSDNRNTVYGGTMMRNEFGFTKGYLWSPSGTSVAFYCKDQSRVTDFPLLDIGTRTGSLRLIKYPMNGMDSERLKVGVYHFETGATVWLDVTDFTEERYITNLAWSPDGKSVYAQVLDRSQHHMRLNQYAAASGAYVRTLLTEDNEAWVEPLDPIRFIKGRTDVFIYRTDNRDGFRNLYLVDTLGSIRRLPTASADLEYLDNDGRHVYYTSAEQSPVENHLFRMELRLPRRNAVKKAAFRKPVQLTSGRGWHQVSLNGTCTWFVDRWSNLGTPTQVALRSTDGKHATLLHSTPDPLDGYASCKVELGTVRSADGRYDNYYRLIYPKDFDPSRQYPLILYVYGGPHSQLVQDSWLGNIRMWEMLMAQRGYFVYIQDNRGTSNRGAAFEKAINRRCGQAEMEDQLTGVRRLMDLPYIDSGRIGVHGWSYGGFMTISLMTTYPDIFKAGVAGGPVIDWRWYEIMYGERYMDTPETNPEGFEQTSLLGKARNLKGKLLICQGAVDDTVVWEHSLSFIQQCIDLQIPVDYFPYPTAEHNVFGRNRIHLMDKVTDYFERNL